MTIKQLKIMEKTKFTPGPWRVYKNHIKAEGKNTSIAQAFIVNFDLKYSGEMEDDEECKANAKLIAAAPLLYEACEWAIGVVTDKAVYEKLKQALSAAK